MTVTQLAQEQLLSGPQPRIGSDTILHWQSPHYRHHNHNDNRLSSLKEYLASLLSIGISKDVPVHRELEYKRYVFPYSDVFTIHFVGVSLAKPHWSLG